MVHKSQKVWSLNFKEKFNKVTDNKNKRNVNWVNAQMKREHMKSYIHFTKISLLTWQGSHGAKFVLLNQISILSTWIYKNLKPTWHCTENLPVMESFWQTHKNVKNWLTKCWSNGLIWSQNLNLFAREDVALSSGNLCKVWKRNISEQWMIWKQVCVFDMMLDNVYQSMLFILILEINFDKNIKVNSWEEKYLVH